MIPFEFLAKIEKSKDAKNGEGDDFLDNFKLKRRVRGTSPTVCGHLKTVFKEGDAPADYDDQPERRAFKFQMAVPGKGHKYIGTGQQDNWQPAG